MSMGDFRPISHYSVLYKITAEVFANRLKPLLDGIISNSKNAFVLGRMIIDNVIIAFEVHHYLKRKTQGINGFVAIKIDMSKAYNRVEWGYLKAIMGKLGFCEKCINFIC